MDTGQLTARRAGGELPHTEAVLQLRLQTPVAQATQVSTHAKQGMVAKHASSEEPDRLGQHEQARCQATELSTTARLRL